MWRIVKRLYLGDELDAQNRPLLRKHRITHVLNCAYGIPCYFAKNFEYLHIELHDPDEDFAENIPEICDFINAGRRTGKVLVHCHLGISRSPTAILAYLLHRGKTLEQSLNLLSRAVDEEEDYIPPHADFLDQLKEYEAELEADAGGERL